MEVPVSTFAGNTGGAASVHLLKLRDRQQDWSKRLHTRAPWQNLKQCEMNTEESYFSIRSLIPNCEPVSPLLLRGIGELLSSGPYILNYL